MQQLTADAVRLPRHSSSRSSPATAAARALNRTYLHLTDVPKSSHKPTALVTPTALNSRRRHERPLSQATTSDPLHETDASRGHPIHIHPCMAQRQIPSTMHSAFAHQQNAYGGQPEWQHPNQAQQHHYAAQTQAAAAAANAAAQQHYGRTMSAAGQNNGGGNNNSGNTGMNGGSGLGGGNGMGGGASADHGGGSIMGPGENISDDNRRVLEWISQVLRPETREAALLELSKKREQVPELALILWHSFGE